MIGAPPSSAGAVHDSVTALSSDCPVTPDGAVGTVAGVMGAEVTDAGLSPAPLMAITVKVYSVPLVSPVTVSVVAVDEKLIGVWATPPMDGVTRYPVMAAPPSSDGAVQLSATSPFSDRPVTPDGAVGVVAGVNADERAEAGLSPALLMATTVKVYGVPLVSPSTISVVAAEANRVGLWGTLPMNGVIR